MPLIELREITDANRDAVVAIHAGPAEGRFVSSVADYEILIEHVLLGERASADDWPPRYRSWRSAG